VSVGIEKSEQTKLNSGGGASGAVQKCVEQNGGAFQRPMGWGRALSNGLAAGLSGPRWTQDRKSVSVQGRTFQVESVKVCDETDQCE